MWRVLLTDHGRARGTATGIRLMVTHTSRDRFLKLDALSLPVRRCRHGAGRVGIELLLGAMLASSVGARSVSAEWLIARHDTLSIVTVLLH